VSALAGALLALVLVAGLVALAELAARWSVRRAGRYYRYAPYWRTRKDFDVAHLPQFPPTTWTEINAEGERGDPPPRPGERVFRGLVIGGSAAECIYLDQGGTWGAVVQRLLGTAEHRAALGGFTGVHVGNVSRAIVPCEQLAFMMRKMLPRYGRLDLILVMVGAADLLSWLERGAPKTIASGAFSIDKIFEQHPEGPFGWSRRRMALRRLAGNLHRRVRRPVHVEADASGWLSRARAMRAAAPHRVDVAPDATGMLAHFERHLAELLAFTKASGARVILIRQPWFAPPHSAAEEAQMWNFGLGRPYREKVDSYYTGRVVDELMRRVDACAAAVASAAGVEQIDLMPQLTRSARTFYDELHFTPEGAETVGRIVAAAVLQGHARAPG